MGLEEAMELAKALGLGSVAGNEVLTAGQDLQGSLGRNRVLATPGARGIALFAPDQDARQIPVQARRRFDVTGCGGTVVAALAPALGSGLLVLLGAELANLPGVVAVSKPGTSRVALSGLSTAQVEWGGERGSGTRRLTP